MKSFAIGSLVLITNNVPTAGILLQTPIEGLDAPNYRINSYAKPGQNGGVVSSMFYGSRVVTLNGLVSGSSALEYENNRKAIELACAINKDVNGYPIPTRITMTTMAGTSLYFDAYIDKPEMSYDNPNSSHFMITMTAANPYLFSTSGISSSSIFPASGGGFILPVTFPITSTASVGGTLIVNNPGNVATFPIITLNGTLTSPAIYNQTTGKFMQLNYTLASGSTASIDMYSHSITLNGSSSLNGTKSTDSDWWSLATGDNLLLISTSSSSDTGYATVNANPAYVGI